MASTRSIRKRALKKVLDGRRLEWAIAGLAKAFTKMQLDRLQAVRSPNRWSLQYAS